MNPLKKLFGQTAVYGATSIIGRLINFLLTPIYTRVLDEGAFGSFTEWYVYVSFLLILLTHGMETALFKFSKEENGKHVYETGLLSVLSISSVFLLVTLLFSSIIAGLLDYENHTEYVIWFALIIFFDSVVAVPFSKLRQQNKPEKYALFKLISIFLNVGLNLFFILYCPYVMENYSGGLKSFVDSIYSPDIGVGYIFISNLISSSFTFLLFSPDILSLKLSFNKELWKRMVQYSLPLTVAGFAGQINEVVDRLFLKFSLPEDIAMSELGIYSACYKLALALYIFIQAFRLASEPFFFAQFKEDHAEKMYAATMKYFVVFSSLVGLMLLLYMDWVQHFIGKEFRVGIHVVPILILSYVFLGIIFNLSIWYKLTGKTKPGAFVSIFGAVVTIILNAILVPKFSYEGAAWATLICYFLTMLLSYFLGRHYYPVKYPMRKITFYLLLAGGLYYLSTFFHELDVWPRMSLNTLLLLSYMAVIYILEKNAFRDLKHLGTT